MIASVWNNRVAFSAAIALLLARSSCDETRQPSPSAPPAQISTAKQSKSVARKEILEQLAAACDSFATQLAEFGQSDDQPKAKAEVIFAELSGSLATIRSKCNAAERPYVVLVQSNTERQASNILGEKLDIARLREDLAGELASQETDKPAWLTLFLNVHACAINNTPLPTETLSELDQHRRFMECQAPLLLGPEPDRPNGQTDPGFRAVMAVYRDSLFEHGPLKARLQLQRAAVLWEMGTRMANVPSTDRAAFRSEAVAINQRIAETKPTEFFAELAKGSECMLVAQALKVKGRAIEDPALKLDDDEIEELISERKR